MIQKLSFSGQDACKRVPEQEIKDARLLVHLAEESVALKRDSLVDIALFFRKRGRTPEFITKKIQPAVRLLKYWQGILAEHKVNLAALLKK